MATAALSPPIRGATIGFHRSPRHSGVLRPDSLRKSRPRGSLGRESLEGSARTPDEDPLRILDPAQKKLTTIESQRVLAVVDETSRRLEGALVLPFLSENLDRFSVSLGAELVAMLEEFQGLSREYMRLHDELVAQGQSPRAGRLRALVGGVDDIEEVPGVVGAGNRPGRLKPLERDREDVSLEGQFHQLRQELQHCIKSILRDLSKNSSTPALMQMAATERSRAGTQLVDSITGLRQVVHEKLLMTKLEEKNREAHLSRMVERQKESEEQIGRLEAELKAAQQRKDQEVDTRDSQIKRLTSDIKTVEKMAEDAQRRVRSDAAKQKEQDDRSHENTKTELQEKITGLKKSLQEKVGANREKEQEFRKRVFKRETEVDNWIQKYDHEMGEKQDELETLETEFEEEKQQLKELEERLGLLTIEYEVVVKEQEETRKAEEEAARRMKEMVRAATMFQRAWRAYRERTKAARAAKKGKKGKGKGKGKKGKKKK